VGGERIELPTSSV